MKTDQNELWQKILNKPYCDPNKRMDFVLFYDVRDGNPNGDPDAGNLPRMDPLTGHGIVTDVCIKRKIRDYFSAVLGRQIYIQSQSSLNSLYFEAAGVISSYNPDKDNQTTQDEKKKKLEDQKAVGALLAIVDSDDFRELLIDKDEGSDDGKSNTDSESSMPSFREWLASIEIDGLEFYPEQGKVYYLGEAKSEKDFKALFMQDELNFKPYDDSIKKLAKMLATAKKNIKGGAEERKAREAVKFKMCERFDDIRLFGAVLTAGTNAGQIRGPIQLTFGRSIDRIFQMDAAITRCAITRAADWKEKQTEFGRKSWLNWAVYRQHGFFNPLLGEKTGIKNEDLARFWEALTCMFRNSDSASKGEMTMHDIIVFVHDHPRGNAPSHKLFEMVKCENIKGIPPTSESKNGKLIISRDGFDYYYQIKSPTKLDGPVQPYYPLEDIWA